MTDSDRARAGELLAELKRQATRDNAADDARYGLIAKMLMTYPIANASAETGKARGAAYREALDDVPPAVLADAIRKWNRGEAGDHDYRWAPAPAVLRQVCASITEPLREAIRDLDALLSAVTLERAMDPRPIEGAAGAPMLRSMAS